MVGARIRTWNEMKMTCWGENDWAKESQRQHRREFPAFRKPLRILSISDGKNTLDFEGLRQITRLGDQLDDGDETDEGGIRKGGKSVWIPLETLLDGCHLERLWQFHGTLYAEFQSVFGLAASCGVSPNSVSSPEPSMASYQTANYSMKPDVGGRIQRLDDDERSTSETLQLTFAAPNLRF